MQTLSNLKNLSPNELTELVNIVAAKIAATEKNVLLDVAWLQGKLDLLSEEDTIFSFWEHGVVVSETMSAFKHPPVFPIPGNFYQRIAMRLKDTGFKLPKPALSAVAS
jgi:hypothetical protein